MGSEEQSRFSSEAHVVVFPFSMQGHINPMLQFSKRLVSKTLPIKVTLLIFGSEKPRRSEVAGTICVESICDPSLDLKKLSGGEYDRIFQALVRKKLPEFVEQAAKSGKPVRCLVYDSMMTWVLDLAKDLGLSAASFFTQSCAVCSIYYRIYKGTLSAPTKEESVCLEGLPPLGLYDLPSFMYDLESYPGALEALAGQFSNLAKADWVLVNTFNTLEAKVVEWMANECPIKTIGPTIPSMYLDKRLEDDTEYGLSLFKPNMGNCIQWLDSKQSGSVVYVAFGSFVSLVEKQMEEVAYGLKMSNQNFLWVVRESEEQKLPQHLLDNINEKGLIVRWCPQLEVLAHKSVGCFMTHCGWNSILEGLSLGVPMVALPQWSDQPTNAKLIAEFWQVGVSVKKDADKGFVTREEVEACLREVMEGERAIEMRRNAEKFKSLAKQAVDVGGSSDKNIEEFATQILCHSEIN